MKEGKSGSYNNEGRKEGKLQQRKKVSVEEYSGSRRATGDLRRRTTPSTTSTGSRMKSQQTFTREWRVIEGGTRRRMTREEMNDSVLHSAPEASKQELNACSAMRYDDPFF
jgi:hypothetical protein